MGFPMVVAMSPGPGTPGAPKSCWATGPMLHVSKQDLMDPRSSAPTLESRCQLLRCINLCLKKLLQYMI